jgi:hypothetical protein
MNIKLAFLVEQVLFAAKMAASQTWECPFPVIVPTLTVLMMF